MTSRRCCVVGVCLLLMVVIQSVSQEHQISCQLCQKTFPEDYNYCPYCGRPLVKTAPTKNVITNSIGMKLKYIPPGEFMMGSPSSEKDRYDVESPQHRVKISKGFYMGIYEVTQAQYKAVMGTNPSCFQGDNNPVEKVSWNDAVKFCRKLSQKEVKTYRLPTEAEWEYACRAGSSTRFSFGESYSDLYRYGNYCDKSNTSGYSFQDKQHDDGYDKTGPVGSYKSNTFGLYDMHGNVWEWCSDWYGEGYYSNSPHVDPQGPNTGTIRVFRGGSWGHNPRRCRSAKRAAFKTDVTEDRIGFRIVLDLE